jgi:SPP1 gp7 family putative phage head morphogenesis protein
MSYWTNRQEQLKKTAEKDEAAIKKRLSKFYDAEFKRLEKEIAAYFTKYGEDNVIEYRTLMQSLSDEDRRLLIEQMDDFAKKYPQYADLMPVRESIYKLDRLQGLQYSVYMAQANIAGYTNEQIKEYETSIAQKGLNYAMETLGFGKNFYSLNSDVVRQFVDVAWSNGENFSTRIWNDTQRLAQYLNQDMAQGFARGDSYDRLVRNLKKRFDRVNRNDAYRLVFTEGTYVMAESTMQPFKEDFEQYRLSPVLDGRTCPICRGLREQVFLISERQPGVNFPPIHPWCRCSWEIVVDDWDKWLDDYVERHSGDKTNLVKEAQNIEKRLKPESQGSIIKNIDIDDMKTVAYGKDIDEQVIQIIYDALKPGERAGDYYISEVSIKSISSVNGTTLLQIEPVDAGRVAMLRLNINQDAFAGKTVDELNEWIKSSNSTVASSVQEVAIHESGHAKTISGLSITDIEKVYAELSGKGIEGISPLAFEDGAEALAEIEVLLNRGNDISQEARDLYEQYIGRKK